MGLKCREADGRLAPFLGHRTPPSCYRVGQLGPSRTTGVGNLFLDSPHPLSRLPPDAALQPGLPEEARMALGALGRTPSSLPGADAWRARAC